MVKKTAAKKVKKPAARAKAVSARPAVPARKPPAYTLVEPREVTHEEIARLAYAYWEQRGFQGGSPEEDWRRAERELKKIAV